MLDHLGHTAHRGCHHGQPEGEGLHDGDPEALPVGCQHEHVARPHDPHGIGTVPEEQQPVTQAQPGVDGADLGLERTLADRDEANVGPPLDHLARRLQEIGIGLLHPEVGHGPDDHRARVDAQLGAYVGALRALRLHMRHLDALEHDLRATLDVGGQRGTDRLGHREPGVVEATGQPVRPAAHGHVPVPHVVVRHDHAGPHAAWKRARDDPGADRHDRVVRVQDVDGVVHERPSQRRQPPGIEGSAVPQTRHRDALGFELVDERRLVREQIGDPHGDQRSVPPPRRGDKEPLGSSRSQALREPEDADGPPRVGTRTQRRARETRRRVGQDHQRRVWYPALRTAAWRMRNRGTPGWEALPTARLRDP